MNVMNIMFMNEPGHVSFRVSIRSLPVRLERAHSSTLDTLESLESSFFASGKTRPVPSPPVGVSCVFRPFMFSVVSS